MFYIEKDFLRNTEGKEGFICSECFESIKEYGIRLKLFTHKTKFDFIINENYILNLNMEGMSDILRKFNLSLEFDELARNYKFIRDFQVRGHYETFSPSLIRFFQKRYTLDNFQADLINSYLKKVRKYKKYKKIPIIALYLRTSNSLSLIIEFWIQKRFEKELNKLIRLFDFQNPIYS